MLSPYDRWLSTTPREWECPECEGVEYHENRAEHECPSIAAEDDEGEDT